MIRSTTSSISAAITSLLPSTELAGAKLSRSGPKSPAWVGTKFLMHTASPPAFQLIRPVTSRRCPPTNSSKRWANRRLTWARLVQLLLNFSATFTAGTDAVTLELPLLLQQTVAVGLRILLSDRTGVSRRGISRHLSFGCGINRSWFGQQGREPSRRHDSRARIDRRRQRRRRRSRIDGRRQRRHRPRQAGGVGGRYGGNGQQRQTNYDDVSSHANRDDAAVGTSRRPTPSRIFHNRSEIRKGVLSLPKFRHGLAPCCTLSAKHVGAVSAERHPGVRKAGTGFPCTRPSIVPSNRMAPVTLAPVKAHCAERRRPDIEAHGRPRSGFLQLAVLGGTK